MYNNTILSGKSFINDKEKMNDFYKLNKSDFLRSYSYLTVADYDTTVDEVVGFLIDKCNDELHKYIMSDTCEYPDDEFRSRISKAYKINVMVEIANIFECDCQNAEFKDFAKSLLGICKDNILEFLYERWIENDTLTSIREDIRMCMMDVVKVNAK